MNEADRIWGNFRAWSAEKNMAEMKEDFHEFVDIMKEELSRWIPVGERLPEGPGGCLIADYENGVWGESSFFDGKYFDSPNDVSHWMPGPGPPEPPGRE